MTEDHWDRDLFRTMRARAEQNAAERDRALSVLALLVAFVDGVGGFMRHEDQAVMQEARALLAEHGGG
jgi:hypothetical protein